MEVFVMTRNNSIEALRFLLAMIIVWGHFYYQQLGMLWKLPLNFPAYLCVDCFFIISGYFLYNSTKNVNDGTFLFFIKKKIIRLWPLPALILLIYYVLHLCGKTNFLYTENILSLFFMQNIGITFRFPQNGATWFISVLFFVSMFYWYLINNYEKKNVFFITALLVYFSFSFMIAQTSGHIGDSIEAYPNGLNKGIVRGIAEIGLGILIAALGIESTKKYSVNLYVKCLYGMIELFLLSWLIWHIGINRGNFNNDIVMVLAFVPLFALFLQQKGIISILLDNKISNFLGRISFAIFVVHLPIKNLINATVVPTYGVWMADNKILTLGIEFLIVLAVATSAHYLVEKPCQKYLSNKFLIKNQ